MAQDAANGRLPPYNNGYAAHSQSSNPSLDPQSFADAPEKPEDVRRWSDVTPTQEHHARRADDERDLEKGVDSDPESPKAASKDEGDGESGGDSGKQQQEQQQEEEKDPNLIEWDGPDDPGNPMNWPVPKRWGYTALTGLMTFVVTFASSVFSTATMPTAMEFGVSAEVMTLGTSLFVLGFAFGPFIWGPFSELYGRKPPLFIGYFIFAIFNIPVAVAQNLQTIFVCRFFGGFFASAPLAVVGGLLADMWDPVNRGIAVCVFSAATFIGPVAGPVVGGFVTQSYLGWRWTQWLTLIAAASMGTIAFFLMPETFAPILLHRRAQKIRFETRNWAIHSRSDESPTDFKVIVDKYLLRPVNMSVKEPILVLITLYMGFIYGILYLFFEVYPISFQEQRGYNLGVGALPFISILIGVVCGFITITVHSKTRYARILKEQGTVPPEERLVPMILGGLLLPIGLFWFAWTSNPHITPWPQIIAGVPIGWGIQMIFLQGLNFLIDVYLMHANSAIAANTFFRSWLGAGFPMFAMAMYHNLGVPWATSLLGFLCVALFPVPVAFFIWGHKIRKWSKYSPT